MKLTLIDDSNLSDNDIDKIVYDGIEDDFRSSKYGLVFGNSMLIKERVTTAVNLYNNERVKKLIFMGGVNGVSNQDNSNEAEAIKMKKLALQLGVKEEDILVDDKSNNSFENVDNALEIIGSELESLDNIIVVTSEFHLKRCLGILNLKCPNLEVTLVGSKDGFSDRDNWFLSDSSWNSGRSLATYEAHLLVKYAKESKIADLEIESYGLNK